VLILNGLVAGMISHQVEFWSLFAERIQRSWEVWAHLAMGRVLKGSGSPIVGRELAAGRGKRKKQVPRCARNDNSRAFGRSEVGMMGSADASGRGRCVLKRVRRRSGGLFSFGSGPEEVVVGALDGIADGLAPVVGVEGLDVFRPGQDG
jgi:hypothetical protein